LCRGCGRSARYNASSGASERCGKYGGESWRLSTWTKKLTECKVSSILLCLRLLLFIKPLVVV